MTNQFGPYIDGANWANDYNLGGLQDICRVRSGEDEITVIFTWANGKTLEINQVDLISQKKFRDQLYRDTDHFAKDLLKTHEWEQVLIEIPKYTGEPVVLDNGLILIEDIMAAFVGRGPAAQVVGDSDSDKPYSQMNGVLDGTGYFVEVEGGVAFKLIELATFVQSRNFGVSRSALTKLLRKGGAVYPYGQREKATDSRLWYWPSR